MGWTTGLRFLAGELVLRYIFQTCPGAYSASYQMNTENCFPGDKTAGALS